MVLWNRITHNESIDDWRDFFMRFTWKHPMSRISRYAFCPERTKKFCSLYESSSGLDEIIYDENIFSLWVSFFEGNNSAIAFSHLCADDMRKFVVFFPKPLGGSFVWKCYHSSFWKIEEASSRVKLHIDLKRVKKISFYRCMDIKSVKGSLMSSSVWKAGEEMGIVSSSSDFSLLTNALHSPDREIRDDDTHLISVIVENASNHRIILKEECRL
jgi:hypothetical protein